MEIISIDTNFNFYSDANGGDPDFTSPTLKKYHKRLWSKPLPSGKVFTLSENKNSGYLFHHSEMGEFQLGSDAITHSYKNHKRKHWLTKQIPAEVDELFVIGSTIGAYTIFPRNKIDRKPTINGSRGFNSLIDDRFDLTLECIRRFYSDQKSPLYATLLRYKNFFDLFDNFKGYVNFFLLQDLVDKDEKVQFYLPFDDFKTSPKFLNIEDYLVYQKSVVRFVTSRAKRIVEFDKNIYQKKILDTLVANKATYSRLL